MEKKSFQIVMEPKDHKLLKHMARVEHLTIGGLIARLLNEKKEHYYQSAKKELDEMFGE